MRTQLTLLFVFFVFHLSQAQDTAQVIKADTLVFKNKIKLNVKVIEVEPTLVRYRKLNNLEGPLYTSPKADILKINYANGTVDNIDSVYSLNKTLRKNMPGLTSYSEEDKAMYKRGQKDAGINYIYQGDAFGTGVTSFLFGAFGLIPAIITTTKQVPEKRLGYRDKILWENTAYRAGYKNEARRIRNKRVWAGFGIGLGSGIVVSLMLLPKN